jgi:hypothetical protein
LAIARSTAPRLNGCGARGGYRKRWDFVNNLGRKYYGKENNAMQFRIAKAG